MDARTSQRYERRARVIKALAHPSRLLIVDKLAEHEHCVNELTTLIGRLYRHVITVCSKEAAERCPIFLGRVERLYWPFPDPSAFRGTDEQIMVRA